MTDKADDPAFATGSPEHGGYSGMCLRTYIATAVMQGFSANPDLLHWDSEETADYAVEHADALIAKLAKEQS